MNVEEDERRRRRKTKKIRCYLFKFFGFYMNNVECYEVQEEDYGRRRKEGKKIRYEWFTVIYCGPAIKQL